MKTYIPTPTPGNSGANNVARAHLRPKGVYMLCGSWESAQQPPRYVPDKFGPIGPYILGPFCKVDENHHLDLSMPYSG